MKFFELCQIAGVYTLEDLSEFNRRERMQGETLDQALTRYVEVYYGDII